MKGTCHAAKSLSDLRLTRSRLEQLPAVKIARGASYLIMNDVGTTIIGVVSFAIIVRLLTPTEIGVMATLLLVLELSQTVVSFGLPSAINKFVAQSDRSASNHLIRVAFRLVFVCSAIAGAFTILLSSRLSQYLSGTESYVTVFALLGAAMISAGSYDTLTGVLMGKGKVKELATLDAARFVLQQILATGLVLLGWRLAGVMTGWIIGYAFFAFAGYLAADGHPRLTGSSTIFRKLLRFSAPLYARDFVGFGYGWVDRALLLLFVPLSELGIYNVAFIGYGILVSMPAAITASLFPHYSKLSMKSKKKLEDAVWAASRYIALIVSPVALGLAALAPTVLRLLGGPAYQGGAVALAILSVSLFATLSYYSLGSILVALDRPRQQSIISVVSILISLVFGVALIPRLGMNGSAFARGAGMIAGLMATIWLVKKEIALKFDMSAISKSGVAGIVMALLVFSVEVWVKSALFLPAYILVGIGVYVLILRLEKAVNVADIQLLKAFAGDRLGTVIEVLRASLVT